MSKRIIYRQGDTITIVTVGTTSNKKIAEAKEKIVQTYHFSKEQYDIAQGQTSMREFFSHDGKVCFDCPFAVSNGAQLSACYTHKMMQYSGFLSSLRSIGKLYDSFDDIPEYSNTIAAQIVTMCDNKYVRFGTYGEPSLMPIALVKCIVVVAKSWTGYTHQWRKKPEYAPYFMASTHTEDEERIASLIGYRSFVASPTPIAQFISCPASAEMGFKSNCSKCGLCSGTKGKGKKSVIILEH
jgi:hypothetical protein